jgi:hypothetical protein
MTVEPSAGTSAVHYSGGTSIQMTQSPTPQCAPIREMVKARKGLGVAVTHGDGAGSAARELR